LISSVPIARSQLAMGPDGTLYSAAITIVNSINPSDASITDTYAALANTAEDLAEWICQSCT
jgi:hypothetical protein